MASSKVQIHGPMPSRSGVRLHDERGVMQASRVTGGIPRGGALPPAPPPRPASLTPEAYDELAAAADARSSVELSPWARYALRAILTVYTPPDAMAELRTLARGPRAVAPGDRPTTAGEVEAGTEETADWPISPEARRALSDLVNPPPPPEPVGQRRSAGRTAPHIPGRSPARERDPNIGPPITPSNAPPGTKIRLHRENPPGTPEPRPTTDDPELP